MINAQTVRRGMLLLGTVCALSFFAGPAQAADDVSMTLTDHGDATYSLEGHLAVVASSQAAWQVLTDYNHLSDFVSSMQESQVKEWYTDGILVEQEAEGRVLLFSKKVHVLLHVREEYGRRIHFQDVSGKDFRFYMGSWEIVETPAGLDLVYKLTCARKFGAPNFIAKDAFKKNAERLLREIRQEILRRQERGLYEKDDSRAGGLRRRVASEDRRERDAHRASGEQTLVRWGLDVSSF